MTKLVTIFTDGYADWECALIMATARVHLGMDVQTATPDGQSVTSAGGVKIVPELSVNDIDPDSTDVVLVCGGNIWGTPDAPELTAFLQTAAKSAKVVGGICAGASVLAKAGLLNDVAHTGNALAEHKAMDAYSGDALYRDVPHAVGDKNIVTAAGTAPVTFMREVLARLGISGGEIDAYIKMFGAEHQPAA